MFSNPKRAAALWLFFVAKTFFGKTNLSNHQTTMTKKAAKPQTPRTAIFTHTWTPGHILLVRRNKNGKVTKVYSPILSQKHAQAQILALALETEKPSTLPTTMAELLFKHDENEDFLAIFGVSKKTGWRFEADIGQQIGDEGEPRRVVTTSEPD